VSDIRPATPSRASIRSWLTAQLAHRPQHNRRRSIAIVAAAIAVIALIDHSNSYLMSFKLFYLVPIILAAAWLGLLAGSIAAVACLAVRAAGDLIVNPETISFISFWNWFTDLAMYLVIVWVSHTLISLYRDMDRRVEERTRDLHDSYRVQRQLERELLEVAAHERSAIGREIHDDLCQQLVGTAFATKVLAKDLATRDAVAARNAHRIVGHVEDGIALARRLAQGLLLESIPPSELPSALGELVTRNDDGEVRCRFVVEGDPAVPDAATGAQLLRIAQEALRNALRHARATRVDVVLGGNQEAAFLIIKDDGCGLPPAGARGAGMGLRIMEHRAAVIGGILSIRPAAGKGTAVICHVPRTHPNHL
jgi:signal transduction histidine kinase